MVVQWHLPSGNLTWLWKITIFHGKNRYKYPFSIAMLVYQRVSPHQGCSAILINLEIAQTSNPFPKVHVQHPLNETMVY